MGKFDFFKSIGATPQAVAVLNDQPELFTTLILVLIGLGLEGGLMAWIHFATLKPEQKKKKDGKPSKFSISRFMPQSSSDNRRR